MMTALTIIHVIISLALIVVVLMQHGKQQGLSGAIAGGAETFFGKNKGRTVDAMLKKFTAVVAVLFIISSVAFAAVAINKYNSKDTSADTQTTQNSSSDAAAQATLDENGNLVDADGNVLATAEDMQKAQESQQSDESAGNAEETPAAENTEAPAASETPAE
mgnify:FL=1